MRSVQSNSYPETFSFLTSNSLSYFNLKVIAMAETNILLEGTVPYHVIFTCGFFFKRPSQSHTLNIFAYGLEFDVFDFEHDPEDF
jgi:hypothetical protein